MFKDVTELVAYLNGKFVPFAEAKLPVYDLGIMQGATVTERLRTMRHQPYQVLEHLQRLRNSLMSTGIQISESDEELQSIIEHVVLVNCRRRIHHDDDVTVVIFVTAGQSVADSNGKISESRPTVCVYTASLPFAQWAIWHREGVQLDVPTIRQIPGDILSPAIKHRSRLHWNLAEQQVRHRRAGAMSILLDDQGFVTETSSGNLFVVREGQLLTPREESTLSGIAQTHVIRLAARRGLVVERADMHWEEVATADEAFLTSSTYCLVPVSQICGRVIGQKFPGPITEMLLADWSNQVGISFSRQAIEATTRE